MKPFFKFCIPKILFLLLITNTGIRPAAILPTLAAEELARLVIMCTAAIHAGLVRYNQSDKDNNKTFPINVSEESALTQSAPIQIILVAKKSDSQVVAEVTQAVTKAFSMKHNLSVVDQKKLDKQLRSQKQTFINTMAGSRNWERTQNSFNTVRSTTIRPMILENKAEGQIWADQRKCNFLRKNHEARLLKNLPKFQKEVKTILAILVNCNNPDLVRRIEARMQLSDLAEGDADLFGDIRELVCNLQARYFYKDKLVDISIDRRLAETVGLFFKNSPCFRWKEEDFKMFVDVRKKEGLDPRGYYERMYRRMNGQLSAEETKQNGKYESEIKLGRGKFITYDRHKQILNEPYNKELFKIVAYCKNGRFEEARAVAKRFREDLIMMHVINHYQQKLYNQFGILKKHEHLLAWKKLTPSEKRTIASNIILQNRMNKTLQAENKRLQNEIIALTEVELKVTAELAREEAKLKTAAESKQKDSKSLAPPDSDSQSTGQPISTPAPPSLPPPKQDDSDKDKKQEQPSQPIKTYEDSLKNTNLKSNTIKEGFKFTNKMDKHIFSKQHIEDGILDLAKNKNDIIDKFVNIIKLADQKGLLKDGSNQIHTIINNQKVVLRLFIKEGEILMLNGFIEANVNNIGNTFRLLVTEYLHG